MDVRSRVVTDGVIRPAHRRADPMATDSGRYGCVHLVAQHHSRRPRRSNPPRPGQGSCAVTSGKSQAAVEARCHVAAGGGAARVVRPSIDHRPFDHRLVGLRQSLIVVVEAAAFHDPGEAALDHPPPWKHLEHLDSQGFTHDLDGDVGDPVSPVDQLASCRWPRPNYGTCSVRYAPPET